MVTKPEYKTKTKTEDEYYTKKGNLIVLVVIGLGLLGFAIMYATILYH